MDKLLQDLRFAVRSLRRQPGFVAVALATLALGIGTATAMFTVVNGVLLRPLPFHEPANLAMIRIVGGDGMQFPLPDADFLALRANHPAFERVAVYAPTSFNLTGTGTPEVVRSAWATGEFFSTLGVQPQLGRFFVPGDDAPGAADVVVLGHAFWTRRFAANPAIIGQTIRLDDVSCTIVGVARPGVQIPRRELDLWRNRSIAPPSRRGPFYLLGLVRIHPQATLSSARANLDAVASTLKQQHGPGNWSFQAVPLSEAVIGDTRTPLYLLFGAVGILLLIALANVANLLLARATSRQREVAVRAALGAGRARIARQMLTESALLSLAGGALGIVLGIALTRTLLPLGELIIPRVSEIRLDTRVMLFALAVSLLAGLLFGIAPALQASGTNLVEPLRDDQRAGAGRSRRALQRSLVIAEIAMALMLSVGAGLVIRSLVRLQHVDLGFESTNLLTFQLSLPDARYKDENAARAFYQRLRAPAGRTGCAAGRHRGQPAAGPGDRHRQLHRGRTALLPGRRCAGRDDDGRERVVLRRARHSACSWTAVRRARSQGDRRGRHRQSHARGSVLSERRCSRPALPHWRARASQERLDARCRHRRRREVQRAGRAAGSGVLSAVPAAVVVGTYVVVRTAVPPASVIAQARDAVWSIDRELPIARIRTMDQMLGEASADSRFRAYLLGAFGALGLVLAAIGVYGVMAYAVAQRTRELGVRAALGARPKDLVALVVRDASLLAAAGVMLGLIGAWTMTGLMQKLLFQVQPRDPATFFVTAAVLAGAALLAGWLPARRAGRTDPIEVLRQ